MAHRQFVLLFSIAVLVTACNQHQQPPPPSLTFAGLPVSGGLPDAQRAGFTDCFADNGVMRCRRNGFMFEHRGPFDGAVDLDGDDGSGGFDHLTLWHDTDQDALVSVTDGLTNEGWSECFTGNGRWGDQAIYKKQGSPVFLSMDISYWSKRRLRVFPASHGVPQC